MARVSVQWSFHLASNNRVKVKIDKVAAVMTAISALAETRVMAGIPASKAERDDDTPINNAQLMYIHENGAPEINLPARPVVHPAIESIHDEIANGLGVAGEKALSGNVTGTLQAYNAVGIMAQNAMRKKITDGPFVPLSPATIKGRMYRNGGRKRRKGEQDYLDQIEAGVDPAEAQSAAGIKPLIDTGQLRRALTYVIKKIKWNGTMIAKEVVKKAKK